MTSASEPGGRLGSHYGTCQGRTAVARETSPGRWQVKVFDPKNRRAGYDGWVLEGVDWPDLQAAETATGMQ